MGSLFKSPPKPKKVEDAPVINSEADRIKQDQAAEEERRRLAAGGRASTILTSALGDTSTASVASKVLLGDG